METRPQARWIIAALLVVAATPVEGVEKPPSVKALTRTQLATSPDSAISADFKVAKYAPVLRFAANEEFFPTVPFFSAFDGVDNDANGRVDFEDPEEVAPFDPVCKRWTWSQLRDWYAQLGDENKKYIAACFYRVRECGAARVAKIIQTDGARYHRLSKDTREFLDDSNNRFEVFEYYYYYVSDKGITGHPEDIETFVVFVPKGVGDRNTFMIQVGAAHESGDANNVAIVEAWQYPDSIRETTMARQQGKRVNPRVLVWAFVELGGHAMAPDVYPQGELFRMGTDVNWQFHDAWGIRDVVATVGSGALEPYDSWKPDTRSAELQLWPKSSWVNDPNVAAVADDDRSYYWLINADEYFGPNGVLSVWDQCNPDSLLDLECVKRKLRSSLREMPQESFLPRANAGALDARCAERLATWTKDGVAGPPVARGEGSRCECEFKLPRYYSHLCDKESSRKKAEKRELARRTREAKRHIVTEHAYYKADSPTAFFKPYLFTSRFPYPLIQRSSSEEGEARFYIGVADETITFQREQSWLHMRGAMHFALMYECYEHAGLFEVKYLLSPAARITNYLSWATSFPDQRVGAGLVLRINPVFVDSHVFGAEARLGLVMWHERDFKFSSPALQFELAFPWSWRRY